MNYESMSDFEINKRVANIKWPDFIKYEQFGKLRVQDPDGDDFYFDFNNPSDAWPIIDGMLGGGVAIVFRDYGVKVEIFNESKRKRLCIKDSNKLRAAMIVYLMMKEAK